MKQLAALALLSALLAGGCAFGGTTHSLAAGEYAAVNERSARQEATLRLDDGTSRHARHLRLEAGTARWDDPEYGGVASVPADRILQVRYRDRGRGVLVGASWGYIVGAASGIGVCLTGDAPELCPLVGLAITGPVGWLVGQPLGMMAGAEEIYQFPGKPRSP